MSDTFSVNFGGAKVPELPDAGTYELVIVDYKVQEPKKEDSKGRGKTLAIQFKFVDQELYRGTVYHYCWLDYENPWAAKLFFEALSGGEVGDEFVWDDPDLFIGERVGAALTQGSYESNNVTKKKMEVAGAEAFYSVD